jgi:outer membrane protein TolC
MVRLEDFLMSIRIRKWFHFRVLLRLTALPTLFFCATSGVSAQSIFPGRLNLEEAVEKALENNPQTKLSESKLKLADLKIKEAKTGMRPSADFTQSVTRSNNPVFVFASRLEQGRFTPANFTLDSLNNPKGMFNFRSVARFEMSLFDQRQTQARVDQAGLGKCQTELQAEGVRQRLRFDVIRTFYGAILGKEMLKVGDEAVRSAEANKKKANDMRETGMVTYADYLKANVERAKVGQQKLEAENALITTTAELNLLIGDKPELEREIVGDLQEKYFPIADLDTLIRASLQNRPDYLAMELAIQSSKRQTRAVKDLKLPRVEAFGNISYNSPYIAGGRSDYTVGVSLSYTLFDAGRKARLEQAVEAEVSTDAEKRILANQITLEVVRAFQNYKTARAKIEVSIKSVAQAEEALWIVQDRYRLGLATFDQVIGSEAALVRAKHSLLTARYEYYLGYASVLLATGQLTDVRMFD